MNDRLLIAFGAVAVVLEIVCMVPYVRDIFLRKTKPERATWWIWLALGLIAFFAQLSAGAKWSLGLTAGQIVAVGLVAVLSIWFGYGSFKRRDIVSLVVAAAGILLWHITDSPLLAIVIVVAVDGVAFWLTIVKTWHSPHTETLSTWILASLASALGVLAVGGLDITKILYPLYIAIANWVLVWVILVRRREVGAKLPDSLV